MVQQVETVLNQMKRSGHSQQTVRITAAGQVVIPYVEDRVSLVIGADPTTSITLSPNPDVSSGYGVKIPAAGPPLRLHLGADGSIVKGPYYVVGTTFPSSLTWWEAVNHAP